MDLKGCRWRANRTGCRWANPKGCRWAIRSGCRWANPKAKPLGCPGEPPLQIVPNFPKANGLKQPESLQYLTQAVLPLGT